MCDYSLENVRSRPARVGDRLVTTNFGTGTRGFASVDDPGTAVCLMPGTELAFVEQVRPQSSPYDGLARQIGFGPLRPSEATQHKTAIFRQIDKPGRMTHHDALEFPDGQVVLLTRLDESQEATVLQLPAVGHAIEEAKRHERVVAA